ncbi:MAG: methyltransferase domain-containing protein [Phycisphaerae bacterium]|nr:methyltransferase domain-containing protein [Phycisphaerae bacterium]
MIDWEEIIHCAKFYQRPVYQLAASMVDSTNSVLDLGCGYPVKLREYIAPLTKDITGVDLPEVIERIQGFRFGTWIAADLDVQGIDLGRTFDVIICADVIEHLHNPRILLDVITKHGHRDTKIILSTPDSRTTKKLSDGKTPANSEHVREWATVELQRYLIASGLTVLKNQPYAEGGHCEPYRTNRFICEIIP